MESKNLTAGDAMNVMTSRDELLTPNPGFRDLFVVGTLNVATWLPFVTSSQVVSIGHVIPHGLTAYKVGYLNATGGSANCGLVVQISQ